MAALDFPNSPTLGQTFAPGGPLSYRWDGTRWRIAGGLGAQSGVVAFAYITAPIGGYTNVMTDVYGLGVTWNAIAGRTYKITTELMSQSSVAGDLAQVAIVTAGGVIAQLRHHHIGLAANNYAGHAEFIVTAQASAQVSYKTQYARGVGTGTHQVFASSVAPAFILVEDITFDPGGGGGGVVGPPAIAFASSDAHLSTNALYAAVPYTITPLNVTVTPQSVNSKFLIRCSLQVSHVGCDDTWWWFFRNGVAVGNANTGSSSNANRYYRFTAGNNLESVNIVYEWLDAPGTVAVLNYIPGCAVRTTGQTIYINRRGADATIGARSSMTVQEIL